MSEIMRMRRAAVLAIGSLLLGAAGPAAAQSIPNLVGTWKGQAQAVTIGTNPYRATPNKGANFSSDVREFTFTITDQHDNRFSGTSTDGKRTEQLIGGLSPDNRSGVVLDDDGQYVFTIRDNDTLDACYSHSQPNSKVVSCYSWKRQK